MPSYDTEQKRLLIEYLAKNADNSQTIEEITEGLSRLGAERAPGKSTVYRLINKLLADGEVKKFSKAGTRQAAYQLVAGAHCDSHFHLKCTECGRLFHMKEILSRELVNRISETQSFSVSQAETVLYGRCKDCCKTGG